jgi:hypothetical protein
MGLAHCGQCGARSSIWLATCAFCGHQLSSPELSSSRIRAAVFDTPVGHCTRRRRPATRKSRVDGLRLWWSRLRRRLAFTRP